MSNNTQISWLWCHTTKSADKFFRKKVMFIHKKICLTTRTNRKKAMNQINTLYWFVSIQIKITIMDLSSIIDWIQEINSWNTNSNSMWSSITAMKRNKFNKKWWLREELRLNHFAKKSDFIWFNLWKILLLSALICSMRENWLIMRQKATLLRIYSWI